MARLTKRIGEHTYYTQGKYEATIPFEMETEDVRKVMRKLAKYEDLEEKCHTNNHFSLSHLLHKWEIFLEDVQELSEYRKLEEQGLLLRLPCKVGDRTYQVVTKDERMKKYGCTCCTDALGSNCDCAYFTKGEGCLNHTEKDGLEIISRGFKLEDFEKYGKTVFLTKEEAEQKLASMQKGE